MSAPRPLLTSILLSTALLTACDDDLTGSPAEPAELATVSAPERTEADRAKLLARRGRLAESRALGQAKVDRALLDQLAAEQMLRVDVAVPSDAQQSRYVLFAGELPEAPTSLVALENEPGEGVRKEILLGGEDAARPALFRNVAEGTYTVCVAVSPPASPEDRALMERAAAILEADGPGPLSAEKIQAAAAAAQAETGHKFTPIDWRARPVRCQRLEVDARPESRVVALDPA
ncbi:hypothetical protein [Nannocystis punicea]|uniref:Lipoprotein n=1 Tax=Nannocystis punicea TaxID=2995304 RepID=A0ABY7H7C1_9BACT|nr:hypothetical protein [Nannocystis poenicansa]WAS94985.1 hypothetical protein O0S08_02385 [Nannocystis poenicansa]